MGRNDLVITKRSVGALPVICKDAIFWNRHLRDSACACIRAGARCISSSPEGRGAPGGRCWAATARCLPTRSGKRRRTPSTVLSRRWSAARPAGRAGTQAHHGRSDRTLHARAYEDELQAHHRGALPVGARGIHPTGARGAPWVRSTGAKSRIYITRPSGSPPRPTRCWRS